MCHGGLCGITDSDLAGLATRDRPEHRLVLEPFLAYRRIFNRGLRGWARMKKKAKLLSAFIRVIRG
jgi:hypothetical protein